MIFFARRLAVFLLAACCLCSCGKSGLPPAGSPEYRQFVTAYYVGLAGLQTGEDIRAKARLTQASQLAPGEPATWANLALLSVRQQEFDPAYELAAKARDLAPQNSRIEELLGAIEARRGKIPESIAHFRKAVELDNGNLKALYALAEQIDRQGSQNSAVEAEEFIVKIIVRQPRNIAAHVERARLAAKGGDSNGLKDSLAAITGAAAGWPLDVQERLAAVAQLANGADPRSAAIQVTFLRNVLARVPAYRRNLDAIKTPSLFVGDPFERFLKLPNRDFRPAPLDAALAFSKSPLTTTGRADWLGILSIDPSQPAKLIFKSGDRLILPDGSQIPFAGTATRNSILAADLNYTFRDDLVLATGSGFHIYLQKTPGQFIDATRDLRIPPAAVNAAYMGAWAFDIDLDGDLDIVLGTPSGPPVVLRNNGDGSFAVTHPFANIDGMSAFASADVDNNGDPDVAICDAQGHLHLLLNERLGQYRELQTLPGAASNYIALNAADLEGSGSLDFIALTADGAVDRLSSSGVDSFTISRIIQPGGPVINRDSDLFAVADFDNNGAIDILAGSRLFLSDGHKFTPVILPTGSTPAAVADVNSDGRLDILALDSTGNAVQLLNRSSKNYRWQDLSLRAANGHGDQRINSFGIGGEVEIRAGLLTQKQIIAAPILHFGLGNESQTDVARIVWPNGSVQAEFDLKPNQTVKAEQRLKGSCPSLFTWNGKRFQFVKDAAPWSPALGLHINAQAVANVRQTEEWFKVPGEALSERNGLYDLRITGELWETFYIDRYALRAVDHPEGTEIYTDERFSIPGPPLRIFTVQKTQPFACAFDDRGANVSAIVRDEDARYLDTFGRGRYQGVTRDHYVELELPPSAPTAGKLYLIASGWLHPTDATINIALAQSTDPKPKSLSIEVPDGKGNWIEARKDLGFLAGKLKTAVIDISGIFATGAPRKLRLRTNMEIYWDRLSWAPEAPGEALQHVHVHDLDFASAELRYRGFSRMTKANDSSPEIPDYNQLEGTAQRWRDLEGYATRFGDVKPLLEHTDDRYVIQNAGDELRLQFRSAGTLPAGYRRDFVMIGDGWVKDGDYNCTYSKTVLPLPYHGMKDYTQPSATLERDPAYRLHPEDWILFHTRYVTADGFSHALRSLDGEHGDR